MKRRFKKNIICFALIIAIIIAIAAVVKRATVGEAENYSKYIQVAAEDKNISAKKMIKILLTKTATHFPIIPKVLLICSKEIRKQRNLCSIILSIRTSILRLI